MFSTPPKSQIPKTSTPETPKPTHRHPTTSTPESSDNNTSDDSPKISKRELRPPPIKSIIPKLAISSDEDKDKGSGVKGESLISFDLEGISFILWWGLNRVLFFCIFTALYFSTLMFPISVQPSFERMMHEKLYFSSSYVANSVFLFAELSPVDEKKERDIESSSLSRKLLQKSASTTALTLLIQPTGECHLYVGKIVQNVYLMHLLVFISMLKAWHFLIDASYDSLYIEYGSDYVYIYLL